MKNKILKFAIQKARVLKIIRFNKDDKICKRET